MNHEKCVCVKYSCITRYFLGTMEVLTHYIDCLMLYLSTATYQAKVHVHATAAAAKINNCIKCKTLWGEF